MCGFVNNSTESPEVISVEPSRSYTATTTRSWDFLGLGSQMPGDLLREGRHGEDIIIGVVDSGPYPIFSYFTKVIDVTSFRIKKLVFMLYALALVQVSGRSRGASATKGSGRCRRGGRGRARAANPSPPRPATGQQTRVCTHAALGVFGSKSYLAFKAHFPNHWSPITSLAMVDSTAQIIIFWV